MKDVLEFEILGDGGFIHGAGKLRQAMQTSIKWHVVQFQVAAFLANESADFLGEDFQLFQLLVDDGTTERAHVLQEAQDDVDAARHLRLLGHVGEGLETQDFGLLEAIETNILDALFVGLVDAVNGARFVVEGAPGIPSRGPVGTVLHEGVIHFRSEGHLRIRDIC